MSRVSGLRTAAFGDAYSLDVAAARARPGGADAATGEDERDWLAAVVLGARGRYAAATALLTPLTTSARPVIASLASSALASHRRQLGAHAAARPVDGIALHSAISAGTASGAEVTDPDGVDANGAWHDAVLGLAADAVGLGRLDEADLLLRRDRERHSGWRSAVRAGWVSAEHALAVGRCADAVANAEAAGTLARSVGSTRHIIKSDLVLAAALGARRTQSTCRRATKLASSVLEISLVSGVLPLAWAAAMLLTELDPDHATQHRSCATTVLNRVFSRTHTPMPLRSRTPGGLLQTRDDVAADG